MYKLHPVDCFQFMKELPDDSIDVTITDPPYDKRTHQGAITKNRLGIKENEIDFEPMVDPSLLVRELLRITKRWCICFCALEDIRLYQQEAYKQEAWVRAGVWDKINPSPQFSGDRPAQAVEGIAIFHRKKRKYWNGGGRAGIWRYQVEKGNKEHPTQKPLSLMSELVFDFSDEGETVFDPFAGSGSTIVAAILQGRNSIGCENNPVYFQVALKNAIKAQKKYDSRIPDEILSVTQQSIFEKE